MNNRMIISYCVVIIIIVPWYRHLMPHFKTFSPLHIKFSRPTSACMTLILLTRSRRTVIIWFQIYPSITFFLSPSLTFSPTFLTDFLYLTTFPSQPDLWDTNHRGRAVDPDLAEEPPGSIHVQRQHVDIVWWHDVCWTQGSFCTETWVGWHYGLVCRHGWLQRQL